MTVPPQPDFTGGFGAGSWGVTSRVTLSSGSSVIALSKFHSPLQFSQFRKNREKLLGYVNIKLMLT